MDLNNVENKSASDIIGEITPAAINAATAAQGAKADSAVQTIQINGIDQPKSGDVVNLPAYPTFSSLGLGTAAQEDKEYFATAGHSHNISISSSSGSNYTSISPDNIYVLSAGGESLKFKIVSDNTDTTYTLTTGDDPGQVKLVSSDGNEYNASVNGLGSAAYTASSAYASASHNQASDTINAMTGYSKPSATSAIATSDSLNAAIGKLEKAFDGKADSSSLGDYLPTAGGTMTGEIIFTGERKLRNSDGRGQIRFYNSGVELFGTSDTTSEAFTDQAKLDVSDSLIVEEANEVRLVTNKMDVYKPDNLLAFRVSPKANESSNLNDVVFYSPNGSNGVEFWIENDQTTFTVNCGQILQSPRIYFSQNSVYGFVGDNTVAAEKNFEFKSTCIGDRLGKNSNNGAALTGSTLDLWYETAKLNNKRILTTDDLSSHNQPSNTITLMTGYQKASRASAVSTSDSLNEAIGKIERALDDKVSTTALQDYLPLSGGTMTGDIKLTDGVKVSNSDGSAYLSYNSNILTLDVWAVEMPATTSTPAAIRAATSYGAGLWLYSDEAVIGSGNGSTIHAGDNAIQMTGIPSGTGTALAIGSQGDIVKQSSSRRFKSDIEYVTNTSEYHNALMNMKPATFKVNSDKNGVTKLGMIAEDVAEVCNIAAIEEYEPVYEDKKGEVDTNKDIRKPISFDKTGNVENYDDRAVITMLVMEVQRLNKELEEFKK